MKNENLLKRIKIEVLYPPFLAKLQALVVALRARGVEFWAVSGLRSFEEQEAIYAQGRTKPCDQCRAKGITKPCRHVVSNARPGFSPHQYGVAVDFCRDLDPNKAGLQPDWDVKHYAIMAEEAEKLGLESGVFWRFQDAPHIQLPLGKHGIKWPTLIDLYHRGGMPAVWKYLDQFKW